MRLEWTLKQRIKTQKQKKIDHKSKIEKWLNEQYYKNLKYISKFIEKQILNEKYK